MGRRGKPLKKQATTPPVTVRVFSQLLIKGEPEATKEGQGIVIQLVTTFTSCVSEKQSETLEPIEEEEREKMEEEDEDEAKPKQPWVDIVRGNCLSSNGLDLEYHAPTIVDGEMEVIIEEHDVISKRKLWENGLIMYTLGRDLTVNVVKKYMISTWNFVALPDLYYNDEGYFIIRFKSKRDRDHVLRKGPYTIFRQPMFLHEWNPYFPMKDYMMRLVPMWITLPQLTILFWGEVN
ncbi:unnamed protein product [Vicia faba]|uniref:DUF4283 domain-containing protein n=1 Tax=Vicia faba TaxID=3906 RepID=A0AAV0YXA6_VICFA|nr:unnamed protein product [Vicia faba]